MKGDDTMISIPGYQVSGLLSECTRTVVYRAVRLHDQKQVVLKMLRPDQTGPGSVEMLRHEHEVTSRLELEGVVRCYGLENSSRGPVLVLEDFGGAPLGELTGPHGLPLDLFLKTAVQLAAVLSELHQRGIVHCDINPSNILLNSDTGQVKLTGFGLSAPAESDHAWNIPLTSLAYRSPEQTGRMGRTVDYRTDLYSLGVTFYQLLTGRLPFSSDDPLVLIHSHMAREPEPPCGLNPSVPAALSDIVMMLLSKNADDRYQSGYGLRADLRMCLLKHGTGERFALGVNDVPTRLVVARRLYGREREQEALEAAAERIRRGTKEFLLVSGLPGIGKTALIDQFRRSTSAGTDLFASGKFDLARRNVPFSAVIVAFKALIRRILTQNEEQVRVCRQALLQAMGANGQIIIEVIPEVELILGKQPAPSPAGPIEALNRFNRTIQKFVGVFAAPEHPLVLFLDDLQWADPASLNLIKLLMTDPQLSHFLFIGAYRENEVNEGHPLRLLLDVVSRTRVPVKRLHLPPLTVQLVNELISNTLGCPPERSEPLAGIVHAKTGGSPFFVNQMLQLFFDEKMLRYEPLQGWSWSLEEIDRLSVTGNVIDLLVAKIGKLAAASQEVLKVAACIGNKFDLETLEMVSEQSPARTFADLSPALQEGLVIPSREYYVFFHDRIHEAAYSLIPAAEKCGLHYRIGTLALQRTKQEQIPEKIFYLADQLNAGAELIPDQEGRYRLAELDLMAGKKAKASTAYASAVRYLLKGISLLAADSWLVRYELALDLYRECSECQYLSGNFAEAERLFAVIEKNARTALEQAWSRSIRVPLSQGRGRPEEAFRYGIEGLRLLGYEMPLKPGKLTLLTELMKMKWHAKWHRPEHFLNKASVKAPRMKAISDIVAEMAAPAYFINHDVFSLMMLKSFSLSAQYGNTATSPMGYGMYAMIVGSGLGDHEKAYAFGRMGLELAERFNDPKSKALGNFMLCGFIAHWREPLARCMDFCLNGYAFGLESGSFGYASYCAGLHTAIMTFKGAQVESTKEQAGKYVEALRKIGSEDMVLAITAVQRMAMTLEGSTKEAPCFSGDDFDEDAFLRKLRDENRSFLLCLYYTFKLPVLYLFDAYDQAEQITEDVDRKSNFLFALFHSAQCSFYQSLTAAALYPASDRLRRKRYDRILKRNQKRMKRWVENCPANFRNKYLLVSAEIARLNGSTAEADELYDAAIRAAREQQFIHEEGLANELAARFHLGRDRMPVARAYLTDAIACYQRWGAAAKVKQLAIKYDRLLGSSAPRPSTSGSSSDTTTLSVPGPYALDLATVLKTSQAISGEISLDKLLRELMKSVIENAGAQRGVLLLEREGRLCLEAEGTAEDNRFSMLPSLPMKATNFLADSVVLYVARTREPVVLNDAANEGMFTHDPYIIGRRSKSILCVPVINKRRMTGILYLENELASHSFTAERVGLLEALSAQISISLENARLYEEARRIKGSLRESEQKFRTLAETIRTGIVIYRGDRFLYVNPETEAITGYSREEFSRMDFAAVIHPDHLELVRGRAADRLAGKAAPVQYEFKIVRKDGSDRWLMSTAARIQYGREQAMIAALVDITGQKEAEQERLRLYEENMRHYRERIEEEQRHQREKENLLMDIHDGIGGITTNIGLLAEVAQKAGSREDVGKRLQTISQLARDGHAEIRSLMFSLDSRDHSWRSLVAELRSHGAKTFRPHAIAFELSTEIEEPVPRPGGLLFLHLFRIYREALMNIVKHAKAKSVAADLRVCRERLLLTVLDDGHGCDPGAIAGKGRGVSNMTARAAELGGSITITAAKGTRVALDIPLAQLPGGMITKNSD